MSFTPSPLQTLFLWRLLANGGGEFWKDVKPAIDAKDRKLLEAAGLIAVEKRKQTTAKNRSVAALHVALTEQGWDWAASHLDAEISTKSTAAGPILRDVLKKLKVHLERSRTALADFIAGPPSPPGGERLDLCQRIRQAYCRTSGGQWNVRVRLADLRRALADVPRKDLDEALLAMERGGSAVLYSLDDPQETRPEDQAAGLENSLGIRRHIVYIER